MVSKIPDFFVRVDYSGDIAILLSMKGKLFQYELVSSG